MIRSLRKFIVILLLSTFYVGPAFAASGEKEGGLDLSEIIMHHITDAHFLEYVEGHKIPLPVILLSGDRGVEVFSSAHFIAGHHKLQPYNGYRIDHGHIIPVDEARTVVDLSITKNVVYLLFLALLMVWIFRAVAKGYEKNEGMAPRGIQSFFEPIIIYVRDEIIKPNIGPNYLKYTPYLLTLFFFIWFGNILGLTPGAANLTGNIAVTATLAVFTFIITNVSGKKDYWKHVFVVPGVPVAMKPLLVPVEFIGLFTKPFSLLIRLFVAITAGHIVLLSLIGLIFIFHSFTVGVFSSLVLLFINIIELLVATIQAYVFTMFSALYIGMAVEEHH